MTGFRWTVAEVELALVQGRCDLDRDASRPGAADGVFTRVWTDTRSIEPGDLFVALVGERFDGHDFASDAVARGATGMVISRPVDDLPAEIRVFRVDDTLLAYGDLGAHRRSGLGVPVVGLTGSSGKTTTKEFLRAALATVKRVHATRANLNNRIGVPAMLLATPDDAEVVVVEMGTSEPGEIARLAEISRPDLAIVITVGEAHLEELGSLDGVYREKLDLLRGRKPGGASLVGDLPAELPERARRVDAHVGVAGATDRADAGLRPTDVRVLDDGCVAFRWNGEEVRLSQPGLHVAQDAWIALAAAEWLGVGSADAARGVAGVVAGSMRNEVRSFGPVRVVVDCYNANPQSTTAALDTLAARSGVRVALLGTMRELGDRRAGAHREVLEHALAIGLDAVFATGDFATFAEGLDDPCLHLHADPTDAPAALDAWLAGREATVLLKGSRGVHLEDLLPQFEARFGSVVRSGGEGD